MVFNPGSAPNALFIGMLTDTMRKAAWVKNIYTYKIFGDVVSTFGFVGNTTTFSIKLKDPIALHQLTSFLPEGMKIIPLKK